MHNIREHAVAEFNGFIFCEYTPVASREPGPHANIASRLYAHFNLQLLCSTDSCCTRYCATQTAHAIPARVIVTIPETPFYRETIKLMQEPICILRVRLPLMASHADTTHGICLHLQTQDTEPANMKVHARWTLAHNELVGDGLFRSAFGFYCVRRIDRIFVMRLFARELEMPKTIAENRQRSLWLYIDSMPGRGARNDLRSASLCGVIKLSLNQNTNPIEIGWIGGFSALCRVFVCVCVCFCLCLFVYLCVSWIENMSVWDTHIWYVFSGRKVGLILGMEVVQRGTLARRSHLRYGLNETFENVFTFQEPISPYTNIICFIF